MNVYAAYRDLIYDILREERTGDAQIIRLTSDTKERLVTYYNWVEKRLGGEYSMYSDWLGKLVGNTLRMIYAFVRENCTEEYSGNNPQDDMMERLLRQKNL